MTDDEILHWETGLFIEPQHFQTMQRQNIQRSISERRLLVPFPYGVVKAEIDTEALSLSGGSRISFKSLHAVMESGLVVNKGLNATLADLDFKEYTGGGTYTIYLVVRGSQAAGKIVADADETGFNEKKSDGVSRFKRVWREVPDENTGTDVSSISTRVLDARLIAVVEGDEAPNKATWDALPIMQIIASDPLQINRRYAPPCFRLSGCEDLKKLVEYIEQRAAACIAYIAANVKLPEQSQSRDDVRELLKFHALTTHRAALSHALKSESLTAYTAYGLCLQLLASLRGSSISGDEVVSKYRHNKPWPAFNELHEQINKWTDLAAERWRFYDLLPIGPSNPFVDACAPDVQLVADGWTCVVAVAADSPAILEQVLRNFNIKFGAPLSLMHMESTRLIPWERKPTEALPMIHSEGGVTSFLSLKIDPKSEGWRAVVNSRQLGARYANQMTTGSVRLKFRLYLKPPVAGSTPI